MGKMANLTKPQSLAFFICIFLFFFFKGNFGFFNLFIYFWLRWVFIAAHRLSFVVASGDYSLMQCAGFSLRWLLVWSIGSRVHVLQ